MAIPAVLMVAGKYLATKYMTDENFRKSVQDSVTKIADRAPGRLRQMLSDNGFLPKTFGDTEAPNTADSGTLNRVPFDAQTLRASLLVGAARGDTLMVDRILRTTPSSKLSMALPQQQDRHTLVSTLAAYGHTGALNNLERRRGFVIDDEAWDRAKQIADKNVQAGEPRSANDADNNTVALLDDLTRSSGKHGRYLVGAKLWEERIKPNSEAEASELVTINQAINSPELDERLNSALVLSKGATGLAEGLPVSSLPQKLLEQIKMNSSNVLDGLAAIQEKGAAGPMAQAQIAKEKLANRLRQDEPMLS